MCSYGLRTPPWAFDRSVCGIAICCSHYVHKSKSPRLVGVWCVLIAGTEVNFCCHSLSCTFGCLCENIHAVPAYKLHPFFYDAGLVQP